MKQKPGGFLHSERGSRWSRPAISKTTSRDIADCDWIIEAVAENLEIKRELLAQSRRSAPARRHPLHQHQRHSAGADLRRLLARVPPSISWARTSSIRRATCIWWK